jgi:hypothetical protein
VEAVLQLRRFFPPGSSSPARILVVAPSHFAADVVVGRLARHVPVSDMLRINSFQRHQAVKPNIARYVFMDPQLKEMYGCPTLYQILQYQVVVMTCAQAGVLVE